MVAQVAAGQTGGRSLPIVVGVRRGLARSWVGLVWVDVAVAVVVAVSLVLGSAGAAVDQVPPRHVLDAAAQVILVLGGAGLLLWRRWPAVFLGSEVVLSSVYLARGYPTGPFLIMVGVAAFVFASRRGIWVTLAGAVPAAVVLVVADLVGYAQTGISGRAGAVAQAGWVIVPALIGGLLRETRSARARAAEEAAGRRVEQERLRMQREVHDVVGHGLSVISLQAGVALHVLSRRPEHARSALEAIRATSREALEELRATLATSPVDGVGPYPIGLARVAEIVQQVRAAGLGVELDTGGVARTVPPEVEQVALRVVQESLTNVLRHAGPATAHVQVNYEPERLTVFVDDDGKAAAHGHMPPAGRGLAGLRQRTVELGGSFAVGPDSDGGWRVCATLPAPADPTTPATLVARRPPGDLSA